MSIDNVHPVISTAFKESVCSHEDENTSIFGKGFSIFLQSTSIEH